MNTPSFDVTLALLLNKSARFSFVQGEDRTVLLQVQDADKQAPLDLTGYGLTFALPQSGGGVVKRYSAPVGLLFATAQTLNGQSVFTLPSHGLVAGDRVALQPPLNATLPAPFAADQPYMVVSLSLDTFALANLDGSKLALAMPSSATATIGTSDFAISNAALGEATLDLSGLVTAAASTGQGLDYQLTLTDPDGARRIVVGHGQLDVSVQPCP